MLLATYLRQLGYAAQLARDGDNTTGAPVGAWVFESSPELLEQVKVFQKDDARVEPRSFYRLAKEVRTGMLKYLGL
jgi:hypothetical protein